jgi:hypothetical protein
MVRKVVRLFGQDHAQSRKVLESDRFNLNRSDSGAATAPQDVGRRALGPAGAVKLLESTLQEARKTHAATRSNSDRSVYGLSLLIGWLS